LLEVFNSHTSQYLKYSINVKNPIVDCLGIPLNSARWNHYKELILIKLLTTCIVIVTVLLVEKTGVPGENHRPVASHWQTSSHNVVSSKPRLSGIQTPNVNDLL
jgi:hypothetical protein